jgi:GTP diphosphokinase / guanosine-3',5'-bis(diphosphate) 3'-diphosphatase
MPMLMIDLHGGQQAIPANIYDAEEAARQLLVIVRQYMEEREVEQIDRALKLAQDTFRGVSEHAEASLPYLRRLSPLEHALAVGTILAQMRIDAVGVSAGLIFEAVDAGRLTVEQVETALGAAVARVVGSMLRLNILERRKQSAAQANGEPEGEGESKKRRVRAAMRHQQAETVRKMFFAISEDPRVVLLKLAYRLHAMRVCRDTIAASRQLDPDGGDGTGRAEMSATLRQTLPADSTDDPAMLATETREIYAPLAGRLGMSRMESELEDLAFEILEPEKYRWVRNLVESESRQWRSYVDRVCAILRSEMARLGLKAEVSGRVKHLYSFYKKLMRNASDVESLEIEDLKSMVDIAQIHDLIAFRILVESTPDCYLALGHVHSLWKPKEGRIKDFIANPKPNGYQALHTTVFCLDDQLVEIQIRTFAMHEMAEYGVAMHWHYKDVGDSAKASARELITWLRQLADWQRDMRSSTSDAEFVEAVKGDIFQEQIFVFTPKGEVKDLPVGSTPLDFAYRVHSQLGDKCAGARIISESGDKLVTRMVPLDYELKSGEIVDIITSRTAHPTRDWLNFARTAAARSKIRRYLKIYERDINIQIGQERLDRDIKLQGLRGVEVLTEDLQNWLANEFKQPSFDDLLAAVGAAEIRPHAVAVKLSERLQQLRELREGKPAQPEEVEVVPLPTTSTNKTNASAQLQVAGVSGLLTTLANCCNPLPGDEIIGYISRGKGAVIHRADCRNISRYRERDRERLINVSWAGMSQQRYRAPISIIARDRAGLIRDIATVVSDAGVNMTSVSSSVSAGQELAYISATLEVESIDQMERLFKRLERIKDVRQVERDLGQRKKK